MALQLATSTRNARLNAIETDGSTACKILIYTGSMPANAGAAATGTLLAEFDLASDWQAAASGGAAILNNLPLATTGITNGTAGYFRLTKTDGTTCILQGTITATGGGGDMTFDSTTISTGGGVNITAWTLTDGNA